MNFGEDLSAIFGGLFGNSGSPYEDAMNEYKKWINQGQQMQNPFWQAGVGGIGDFQDWLKGMKDPSKFINDLMGKYQESPWAKYAQDAAMRGAQNMGSATGLTGSTPLAQFAQQNAKDISSADMQNWLKNVLGINTEYGAGQSKLMDTGQNAANSLTNMFSNAGDWMGHAAYGKGAREQYDRRSLWGGLFDMFNNLGLF